MSLDYWIECVSLACDECSLVATEEQIKYIADSVKGGHENYDMAFQRPCGDDSQKREITALKQELAKEKSKVRCERCEGTGVIPGFIAMDCWECGGTGRL